MIPLEVHAGHKQQWRIQRCSSRGAPEGMPNPDSGHPASQYMYMYKLMGRLFSPVIIGVPGTTEPPATPIPLHLHVRCEVVAVECEKTRTRDKLVTPPLPV